MEDIWMPHKVIIAEIARVVLSGNKNIREQVLSELDLSDEEAEKVLNTLNNWLEGE